MTPEPQNIDTSSRRVAAGDVSGEVTKVDDGGPAFPQTIDDCGTMRSVTCGMSLRDWFAGMAMQAILSHAATDEGKRRQLEASDDRGITVPEMVAAVAFKQADALIAYSKGTP